MYDAGPQGLNRYSYALNNPIVYRDPTGHQTLVLEGAAAGTAVCGPPCSVAGALIGLGLGLGIWAYIVNNLPVDDVEEGSDVIPIIQIPDDALPAEPDDELPGEIDGGPPTEPENPKGPGRRPPFPYSKKGDEEFPEGASKATKKTSFIPEGVGKKAWRDPKKLRFSQRTVTENNYQQLMEQGKWNWSMDDPLIVIDRGNGVLVSLDNRRLNAAILSNQESVPVIILKPSDTYLDYKTWRTAEEAFQVRQEHPNTILHGGPLPPEGTSDLPQVLPKKK